MTSAKILDCTLRDGGYLNNWDFNKSVARDIINGLLMADINFIECGFIKDTPQLENSTIFSSLDNLFEIIPLSNKAKFAVMINYGEVNIENIPQNRYENITIRLAFKKHQLKESLCFSKKLLEKGYCVSLNPMHTSLYSNNELDNLIKECNQLKIESLTVVDTMGIMTETDTVQIFDKLNCSLNSEIALGFHSHNNLELAYKNSLKLLEQNLKRKIIFDSCLLGIGRGAGILETESIAEYLNQHYSTKYNINILKNISSKYIKPIISETNWKYNNIYYLSAQNHCHPNYATYIIKNTNFTSQTIEEIFSKIPSDQKTIYSEKTIKKIIETQM